MVNGYFENPKELIDEVINTEEIYNIKVKCLGCRAGAFIPCSVPIIQDGLLQIGEHAIIVLRCLCSGVFVELGAICMLY